jgi:dicarboxylate transporter 10
MTSDLNRPHHQRYHYRNAATGLFTLLHKEGLNGLRRGIGANTVRAMLMNVCILISSVVFRRHSHGTQISQVGSYDYAKQTLLHAKIPGFDYQFQDNLVLHTISSGFAGFVATSSCGLPL